MNLDFSKVLVGVSGGVDSSVCVDILRKQGLEVIGTVINFSPASQTAVEDAKIVGRQLGIPVYVADAQQAFIENVTAPFCKDYLEGKTPNPCVVCNPLVKFAVLRQMADSLGIGYIATGHYAQIGEKDGQLFIKKAVSDSKDQSYMLYRLPQDLLPRLILPIGAYEKPSIRQVATDLELITADKPDSQDICFIPDGDYISYIMRHGGQPKDGYFISPDGKKLKKHGGVHKYTIGQRKGLGVALGKPAFVKEIKENGDILLGFSGEEFFTGAVLSSPVYSAKGLLREGDIFSVKVRSSSKGEMAKIIHSDENNIEIEFLQPARAVAKGQSAVLYDGDLVIGGGFIEKAY